jgi:hypothetical protein
MGRKRQVPGLRHRESRLWLAAFMVITVCGGLGVARGQQSYSEHEARLKEMTPDQKELLRRNKVQFDGLGAEEQQRLRELHLAITTDSNAKALADTVTRYNRWLATLDPTDRDKLLDMKDPAQKIARIKELMQQQEKRRFDQYFANLPEEDRKTIYRWLGEFVAAHADEIREKLPPPVRQRIADAPDEEVRRREIFGSWQRFRREFNLPLPSADDYNELFKRFSAETQKTIESSAASELSKEPAEERTPERQLAFQQRKMEELVRTALYSRFFPQIGLEELLKYYAAMKPDDERRKLLEGKEGEELRRELQRMYNWEHGVGRGWPPGRPGMKVLIRRDGKSDERFEGKDRGPPPPPVERPN